MFHGFISDECAARLLRASHTVATSLLPGYTFHHHIFKPDCVEELWRLKGLCEAYDVRQTRMCLSEQQTGEMALEQGSGRAPFPSPLKSLLIEGMPINRHGVVHSLCMFGPEAARAERVDCSWLHPRSESLDEWHRLMLMDSWRGT